jgi:hypothetical protein
MTSNKRILFVALASLGGGTAIAQPIPDPDGPANPEPTAPPPVVDTSSVVPAPPPDPQPTTISEQPVTPIYEPYQPTALERLGFSLTAGGGVEGFTGQTLRNTTSPGGNWDVRASIGTKSILGFEASYIGSAQAIEALGLDKNAVLVGNGVQGALRLNATENTTLQPFVFAGIGWRRYSVSNTSTNTSDVSGSDDVLEIPMGVGLAYKFKGFTLDARGEFRAVTNNDLMPAFDASNPTDKAPMHRWGANANLGYEF